VATCRYVHVLYVVNKEQGKGKSLVEGQKIEKKQYKRQQKDGKDENTARMRSAEI
jgi:hypothetical protein